MQLTEKRLFMYFFLILQVVKNLRKDILNVYIHAKQLHEANPYHHAPLTLLSEDEQVMKETGMYVIFVTEKSCLSCFYSGKASKGTDKPVCSGNGRKWEIEGIGSSNVIRQWGK